jgi:hypothetical protein
MAVEKQANATYTVLTVLQNDHKNRSTNQKIGG